MLDKHMAGHLDQDGLLTHEFDLALPAVVAWEPAVHRQALLLLLVGAGRSPDANPGWHAVVFATCRGCENSGGQ